MQTFLPYADFQLSAQCLDFRRAGKQRVEAFQILNSLKFGSRWQNHPAVLMWKNYENALCEYGLAMCEEWIKRGYKDTLTSRIKDFIDGDVVYPWWLGDEEFHQSHQSNLLRKNPDYYGKFNWEVSNNLPYMWPVRRNIKESVVV